MKRNKILLASTAIMAALTLSACQNNKSKTTAKLATTSSKVKKTTPKKMGTLKAEGLSPQETVSVVTAYAGKKFGQNWLNVMNKAQHSNLEVTFDQRSDHPSISKGQGYVYVVGVSGTDDTKTYYTLTGDGESQVIYFYQGAKYLGQNTIKEIIKYLNRLNCDTLVQKLAKIAEVGGQSADNSSNSADSNSSNTEDSGKTKKSNLPGDAGIYTTPEDIRGTWYSYYKGRQNTVKVTAHRIISDSYNTELHKQKSSFASNDAERSKFVKDHSNLEYGAAEDYSLNGLSGVQYRNWTGGVNTLCLSHTENGQPIILLYDASAGFEPEDLYWKTPELAKKYSGQHFSDLKRMDREEMDKETQDNN